MQSIETTIESTSPEDVWPTLTDFDTYPEWYPFSRLSMTPSPAGTGDDTDTVAA